MTDLGVCGAFLADGRCDGRLIVDRETGRMVEAVCSKCGDTAARPVARLREVQIEQEDECQTAIF